MKKQKSAVGAGISANELGSAAFPGESEAKSDLLKVLSDTDEEDFVQRFILNYWKVVLVGVLAIAAGIYMKQVFEQSQRRNLESAADLQRNIEASFREMTALNVKLLAEQEKPEVKQEDVNQILSKIKEEQNKFNNLVRASSDSPPPYKSIGVLYSGLAAAGLGDPDRAKEVLNRLEAEHVNFRDNGLVFELLKISVARSLIDKSRSVSDQGAKTQSLNEGKVFLKGLVSTGKFMPITALITLNALAQSEEEKMEVERMKNEVKSRLPEQEELISRIK